MKGKRLSADGLSLFYRQNTTGGYRVGISVGKKLGNAVRRNRLRRQIRDSIGRIIGERSAAYDLVFVARPELAGKEFAAVLAAVTKLLQRSSVLAAPREGATP